MTTDVDDYRTQLLLALRLRDLPGPRIAEVLAEVDSHAADSGEDPREAFGPPSEYADQLIAAWRPDGRSGWRAMVGWRDIAIGVVALLGGWLISDGAFSAAAGDTTVLGLPGLLSAVLGIALWGALAAWLLHLARLRDDRALDPRTGLDMAPPAPRWSRWVLVASLVVPLGAAVALGLMER